MTNTALPANHRVEIATAMQDYSRELYDLADSEGTHTDLGDTYLTLAIQYGKDATAVLNARTVGVNDDFLVLDPFVRDMAQTALIAQQERLLNEIRGLRADLARVEKVLTGF